MPCSGWTLRWRFARPRRVCRGWRRVGRAVPARVLATVSIRAYPGSVRFWVCAALPRSALGLACARPWGPRHIYPIPSPPRPPAPSLLSLSSLSFVLYLGGGHKIVAPPAPGERKAPSLAHPPRALHPRPFLVPSAGGFFVGAVRGGGRGALPPLAGAFRLPVFPPSLLRKIVEGGGFCTSRSRPGSARSPVGPSFWGADALPPRPPALSLSPSLRCRS